MRTSGRFRTGGLRHEADQVGVDKTASELIGSREEEACASVVAELPARDPRRRGRELLGAAHVAPEAAQEDLQAAVRMLLRQLPAF